MPHNVLLPRTIGLRNNVKSFMIQKLIHDLEQDIADTSTQPGVAAHVEEPPHLEFTIRPPTGDALLCPCGPNITPCLSSSCAFLQYLTMFFPTTPFWLLPATGTDGKCIICKAWEDGTLRMSQIRITQQRRIVMASPT